jgi:endoglucanase
MAITRWLGGRFLGPGWLHRATATSIVIAIIAIGFRPALLRAQPVDPRRGDFLVGVNLAGAEFGSILKNGIRGQHGTDYVYPVGSLWAGYKSPQYFLSKGMNIFRLPFLWERVQPQLGQPLDEAESKLLVEAATELVRMGAWVNIDLHNYARYAGQPLDSTKVTLGSFADVWGRIANLFKGQERIIFGLMNEPHDIATESWVAAANTAIGAIRAAGANNMIFVAGNHWSSAQAWYSSTYGTPNAKALLSITDPLDRVVFEAHTYLDSDSSGTHETCINSSIGVERLQPFTRWLTEHGKIGFLGEFGAGKDPTCLEALSRMLEHMRERSDVYLGWTYWAAGPWWPNDYFTLIEPVNGDAPQMQTLSPYLRSGGAPKTRVSR